MLHAMKMNDCKNKLYYIVLRWIFYQVACLLEVQRQFAEKAQSWNDKQEC